MERVRIFDGYYEMAEAGYTDPEPIIHAFGRDTEHRRRHIRVEGFHPYLTVPLSEVMAKTDAIDNDHRIRRIEWTEDDGGVIESLDGQRLAKVYTVAPYHVPKIRANFSEHFEADVPFFERFCIDKDIRDTIDVDSLSYLSIDAVADALGESRADLCLGCVTGEYPYEIEGEATDRPVDRPVIGDDPVGADD